MEKFLNKLFKKDSWIFLIILFIGFIIRFYQLGNIPSSMNRDEPAIGYNAYSILKTGKDEWGKYFPLVFKSFGDYKSPIYIYLTTLPIVIFGLNELSVRFWGAIAGVLLILLSFLLTRQFFSKKKKGLALVMAFCMALGSWQIFYSRFSFEANLALCFNVAIIYLFLKNNFERFTPGAMILLFLSFLTYASSLIIWPVFIVIWSLYLLINIIHKKKFTKKELLTILSLFIVYLLMTASIYYQNNIGEQKGRVTIFENPQLRLDFNQQRTMMAEKNLWLARIFYNQYIYYGKILWTNYWTSFSPNFLFGGGGQHPWHKIPQIGHFYQISFILILLGIIVFIKDQEISRLKKIFIISLFLLTPFSSAITIDSPHATRLLNLFFFLTLFMAFGLYYLWRRVRILGILAVIIIVFNSLIFGYYYFNNYKDNPPKDLLPGIKQVVTTLKQKGDEAERIIFDDNADGSYIYLLFYLRYDPNQFLQEVKRYSPDTGGLEWVENFNRYYFVNAPIPNDRYKEIYVVKGSNKNNKHLITQIKNQTNGEINYIVTTNY
jgi:4-amino-4-deoxy-L-arabinose transferase-like glycosyltransferase